MVAKLATEVAAAKTLADYGSSQGIFGIHSNCDVAPGSGQAAALETSREWSPVGVANFVFTQCVAAKSETTFRDRSLGPLVSQ